MSFLDRFRLQKRLKESAQNFQVSVPMYAIYDKKAKMYTAPFLASNHLVAIRMVCRACNSPDNLAYSYPDDYRLDHIGFFTDCTGELTPLKEKEIVMEMSNILGELSLTGEDDSDRID